MESSTPTTDTSVDQFWRRYLALCRQFRVPEKALPWYRRHVERMMDAHAGMRLRAFSADDVARWLEHLARDPALADWRMRQTVEALRLLFGHLLKLPWSSGFDWDHWLTDGRRLEQGHPTVARL